MAVCIVCVLNDDVLLSTHEHTTVGPYLSLTISLFHSLSLSLTISFLSVSSFVSLRIIVSFDRHFFCQKCNFVYVMGCLDKNCFSVASGWDKIRRRIARINEWHRITIFLWHCMSVCLYVCVLFLLLHRLALFFSFILKLMITSGIHFTYHILAHKFAQQTASTSRTQHKYTFSWVCIIMILCV